MNTVVIVEDDSYLREELEHTFIREGYKAVSITSFEETEREILKKEPDLIVLDVNLPGRSGFELCKWLKSRTSIPILILTARDTLTDELYALGLGADDFLTKPCHPKRLVMRVKRLLTTYNKVRNLVRAGDVMLDVDTCKVIKGNQYITLPETEGKILKLLMERCPSVVSKQEITDALWGGDEYVDENILQVNMTRLRKNLDVIGLKSMVRTERGKGYCLEVKGDE